MLVEVYLYGLINSAFDFEIIEELSIFEPHIYESIFVKIKVPGKNDAIFGNIYRPNTAPLADLPRALDIHNSIIEKIRDNNLYKKCDVTLCGDLNIDLLQFMQHNLTNQYLESLLSFGYLPIITNPTRIYKKSSTLIDHIFSNKKDYHFDSGILLSPISDHFPVFYIEESTLKNVNLGVLKTRKIDEISTKSFCELLKTAPFKRRVTDIQNPENAFDNFFEIINEARDLAFPETEIKPKKDKIKHSPWMTQGLLVSLKQKQKLFSLKLRKPTESNIAKFKSYNSLYNKIRRKAIQTHYELSFKHFSKDMRNTWRTIREVMGTKKNKDEIPSFFRENGHIITELTEITKGFNNFFSGIGPQLADAIPRSDTSFESFLGNPEPDTFMFSHVHQKLILEICSKLKPKASSGPDLISSKLLKTIMPIIVETFCHLINLSFKTGYIPKQFKLAKVVPIFKSGERDDFNNYRPISLLSSFSKLFEKIVAMQVLHFLNHRDLFYIHQYGFRKGHSTSHPVYHFLDKIYCSLDKETPEYTLGIFIDLKKAFDTVDHEILLKKLEFYGFRNVANTWFRNYLTGRTQYVSINGVNIT